MTTHVRLLAILVAVSSLGLSAAVAASNDTWKGAWKLEFPPPRDQPSLSYYDTNGKTVFRFGCWTHYEMDAVYPGSAPKQDFTEASITIANGKTQMDFAGRIDGPGGPGAEGWPPNTTVFNQADLGHPELDEDKWGALEDRFLDLLDSGRPLTISAEVEIESCVDALDRIRRPMSRKRTRVRQGDDENASRYPKSAHSVHYTHYSDTDPALFFRPQLTTSLRGV